MTYWAAIFIETIALWILNATADLFHQARYDYCDQ